MSSKNNGDNLIDPNIKEELKDVHDENAIVEYVNNTPDKGSDTIEFADEWFPSENEWQGKTVITRDQAHALAVVRQLKDAFPMLGPVGDILEEMVRDYEMYQTSVGGLSREQQTDILRSAFGDDSESDEATNALANALTTKTGDDDE